MCEYTLVIEGGMGLHHFGKNPDETGSPTFGGPCHFLPWCNVSEVSEIIPNVPPKHTSRVHDLHSTLGIIDLHLSPFQMGGTEMRPTN